MNTSVVIILTLALAGCYLFGAITLIPYWVHYSMNNTYANQAEANYKISYKKLKELILSKEHLFEKNDLFKTSIFGEGVRIHASVILIDNGLYYLKNPIEYLRFKIFLYRYAKKRYKKEYIIV